MVTGTRRWTAAAMLVTTLSIAGLMAASYGTDAGELRQDDLTFSNPSGAHRTFTTARASDRENPFFQTGLLVDCLERMGAFAAVRDAIARSSGDSSTMWRHFQAWFDAFRTRKLIHALRDAGLPSPGYREALAEAPFTGLAAATDEEPETLRQALAAEERKLSASPAGWTEGETPFS